MMKLLKKLSIEKNFSLHVIKSVKFKNSVNANLMLSFIIKVYDLFSCKKSLFYFLNI